MPDASDSVANMTFTMIRRAFSLTETHGLDTHTYTCTYMVLKAHVCARVCPWWSCPTNSLRLGCLQECGGGLEPRDPRQNAVFQLQIKELRIERRAWMLGVSRKAPSREMGRHYYLCTELRMCGGNRLVWDGLLHGHPTLSSKPDHVHDLGAETSQVARLTVALPRQP